MVEMMTWVKSSWKWLKHHWFTVVCFGVVLDLAISSILLLQQNYINGQQAQITRNQQQINQNQAISQCWNHVLTVAVHDHLTSKQRAALIVEANHCADLTG